MLSSESDHSTTYPVRNSTPSLFPRGRAEVPDCIFVQAKAEQQSQRCPDHSPGRGLTKSDRVRFSMKHTEIEHQERYDEAGEGRVEPPVVKEREQMSGHANASQLSKCRSLLLPPGR